MDFKLEAFEPSKKKAFSLLDEFKVFAFKGNVIDLAVGVIIGGAFGNIVKSLVDHIVMPTFGVLLPGNRGYEAWALTIDGKVIPYGKFLGDVVNFVIVASVLFLFIVKFLGWVLKLRKDEAVQAPVLTKDQELLSEIRDLLRSQQGRDAAPTTPEQV